LFGLTLLQVTSTDAFSRTSLLDQSANFSGYLEGLRMEGFRIGRWRCLADGVECPGFLEAVTQVAVHLESAPQILRCRTMIFSCVLR
jgi:hypothetical protein